MARLPRIQNIRRLPKLMNSHRPSAGPVPDQTLHPFGPQMACEIFGVFDSYDYEETAYENPGEHSPFEAYEEDWYQTELPLENVRELEERFRREIKKMERAYRKMALHALKWHYLMEDLEDNSQLRKMFNDIQLMRKLGGSENV